MADNLYEALHPEFQTKVTDFQTLLREQYGLETRLHSGKRDDATQAKLYAQGRTEPGPIVTYAPPGSSYHNYGAAGDLTPVNMDKKQAADVMRQAFADNPGLGLTWGGTFKNLYDPFHVQLGVPIATLRTTQTAQSPVVPQIAAAQPIAVASARAADTGGYDVPPSVPPLTNYKAAPAMAAFPWSPVQTEAPLTPGQKDLTAYVKQQQSAQQMAELMQSPGPMRVQPMQAARPNLSAAQMQMFKNILRNAPASVRKLYG
jgi:peptidoglycan L-alanyl-D-glutamate endopeptidase CwlK